MKYLAILLAIYIFALNLATCADYIPTHEDAKTEISHATDNHQHQDSDLCSPFCNCQCCHIHATYFKVVDFKIAINHISTKVYFHFDGLEKDFNASILQPPQV
jgi:PBP1b-binding outer membrane lipoprotein LpoB